MKLKFFSVDLKNLSIFFLKTKLTSVGFFLIFKICVFSGISRFLQFSFCFFPFFTIRCLNFSLFLFNQLELVKQKLLEFKICVSKNKNLKSFLIKNFLPCNGQRTKTNAKTVKKKRSKKLVYIKNKNVKKKI